MQTQTRPPHTVTIGNRIICTCVGSDYSKPIPVLRLVLGDEVTEKEVKKMPLFKGFKLQFECRECGGDGVVPADEFDPDSGQYQRGVGEQKCICQIE